MENKYNPIIDELQTENTRLNDNNTQYNIALENLQQLASEQESTINTLTEETEALNETINQQEQEIVNVEALLNETKISLGKYKKITNEFYEVHPIRIGFTSATSDQVTYTEDIAEIAERDIHSYCAANDLPYKFDFVIGNNYGDDTIALSNLVTFDTLDINLVVGHAGDSQCLTSLNFATDNDMVLISPSSDISELSKIDNLYRLSPNETIQMHTNLACMKKMEIQNATIFSIRNDWGENLSEYFADLLTDAGIGYTVIYYSDNPNVDITSKVSQLRSDVYQKSYLYGEDHVALQSIGDTRIPDMFGCGYPELLEVLWFGTTSTAYYPLQPGSTSARKVLFISPTPYVYSSKFMDFNREMDLNYDFQVTYYGAAAYDACWLYALAVIETGSTNIEEIKEAIPLVAKDYEGISGICTLNKCGDRVFSDSKIMAYNFVDGGFEVIGRFYYGNQTVTFTKIHPRLPQG